MILCEKGQNSPNMCCGYYNMTTFWSQIGNIMRTNKTNFGLDEKS